MPTVVVKNGNVDGALRTFKQKTVKNLLLKNIRDREVYSKPGERRRKAKKEGIKNSRRRDRRERNN